MRPRQRDAAGGAPEAPQVRQAWQVRQARQVRLLLIPWLVVAGAGLVTGCGLTGPAHRAGSGLGRGAADPEVHVEATQAAAPLEQPLVPGEPAGSGLPQDGAVTVSGVEDAVIALTNAERLAVGCPRLVRDGTLALAAVRHARDMMRRDYFEHVSPDGVSPLDRARAVGFRGGVGENLAVGYRAPRDVVDGWMTSPGHRANILDCRFTLIGVGYLDGVIASKAARGVWVQEFGTAAPT